MSKGKLRRAALVIGVLVAGLVLLRHLSGRSGRSPQAPAPEPAAAEAPTTTEGAPTDRPRAATLAPGDRSRMMAAVRTSLESGAPFAASLAGDPAEPRIVVVSLSRQREPAWVAQGAGEGWAGALEAALASLRTRVDAESVRSGLLKVDLLVSLGDVEQPGAEGTAPIERTLEGLWLEEGRLALLPEELVAWRLVDSRRVMRNDRLESYLEEGGRRVEESLQMRGPFRRARFESFAEGEGGLPERLFRGNRLAPNASPEGLLAASVAGGEYLLRHQKADGWFNYVYEPKRDENGDDYNLLRHAGTCYSLVELARETGDRRYLEAARRGLDVLLSKARGPREEDAGAGADFLAIVSPGDEAKLGGAALALLAMAEYTTVAEENPWPGTMQSLAQFLLYQQGPDGRFESKYFYDPDDYEPFESIYYPGEAILALNRLHRLDEDPRWLRAAEQGARWLIEVRDQGKEVADLPHDHWLLMGLNELEELTGDELYSSHATKIAEAILTGQRTRAPWPDWVGTFYDPPRSTPTATRAEAMVAMVRLAERRGLDTAPYLESLRRMAAFQLRTQFSRENTLYVRRPDLSLGGFRRSLDNWQVRIDYVQHNVSALLGLRRCLQADDPD